MHQIVSLWRIFKMQAKQRQAITTLIQLLATIHKEPHMFNTCVSCHNILYFTWLDSSREWQVCNQSICRFRGQLNWNNYCPFKGKPRNHISLATTTVEIQNKSGQYNPCRALLDSTSVIFHQRCVQRLRLSRTQTHASIKGISIVKTARLGH